MEEKTIVVRIGTEERTYPQGTTFLAMARERQKKERYDIVLARENGKLRELGGTPEDGADISFLTTADPEGFDVYRRSMVLLLMRSLYRVAGHDRIRDVGVHFAVGCGYYCTLKGEAAVDEAFLGQVKLDMERQVRQKLPIVKESVETEEAIRLFAQYGMKDKEKLFHYRRSSRVNLYRIGGFQDYYYGYMVPDTSYLRYFDLCVYGGGFVLLMPERREPDRVPPFRPETHVFAVRRESLKWGERLGIPTVGALNDYIVKHDVEDLILIQEALQEKKIGEIAQQIAEHPQKKLVMIAGPSSSGKTTFSHRLSIQLTAHGLRPHPIALDDYFVDRENTPKDEKGNRDYECLEAIDVEQFNRDMNAMLAGEAVELPSYNFVTGKREYRGNVKKLGREDILVIEGIHGLDDRLSYSLPKENKFKIYISALTQLNIDEHNRIPTTDGRLLRRIVRDARTRGMDARQTIALWPSVRRGEEQYIFPFQEEADVIFNSALIYEFAVLKPYAEPRLFDIGREEPQYQEARRLLKFLDYFVGIQSERVPNNSLLREFIGGGCFGI